MVATLQLKQAQHAARRSEPPHDLSRRFGGLVVLQYLMDLFGDSPKELFSRIDVLTVLDVVKNDRALFPKAVVAMWNRIEAARRTRPWTSLKSLDEPTRGIPPLH